jgi:replicative DNA helicase
MQLKPCSLAAGDSCKTVGDIDTLIQECSPDVVYVDAGYLLTPEKQLRNGSRHEIIASVAEELKQVAVRRSVPIVLTVQFNRDETGRDEDRVPLLANIAGSDVLGQIASLVIAVKKGAAPNEESERRYDIIKDRDGQIGGFTTEYVFSPAVSFKLIRKTGSANGNRDRKRD